MEQTRLQSLVESVTSTAVGYLVALASQLAIFPAFGIRVEFSTNLWIGFWFTLVSLVRGYIIRRWFNQRLKRFSQRAAAHIQKELK